MKPITIIPLLYSAALATLVESSCSKRKFHSFPAKTYTGPMLYTYTKTTQTAEQCQRMCNQILKCSGFVMRWAGPQRGYCDFFKRDPAIGLMESDVVTTVYMNDTNPCRSGYSWRPNNHCYHYNDTSMTLDDAKDYCTSTRPDAYLAEVTSSEETDFIRALVGSRWIWLGGRLLSGTWTWTHSGLDMADGYENWVPGQPNGLGDCIVMKTYLGLWFDLSCGYPRYVVCEYGN